MAVGSWRMVDMPEFAEAWRRANNDVAVPKAYQSASGLTAFVGREPFGPASDPDMRWHISVRYGNPGSDGRVPTWSELVETAHDLRPGVVFVVGVPPRSWWMNVHPDVLHLHETRDEPLIEQYRVNARGQAPT